MENDNLVRKYADKTKIALIEQRVESNTKKVEVIGIKMAEMLENHLPHIQSEIIKIKANYKWIVTIGSAIGGLISGFLIMGFDKLTK